MGLRQEHWSGLPFPFPGDLPDPGIELASPVTPALQVNSLLLGHWGSPSRLFNMFLYTASFQKKDTGFGASQAFSATVFFSISELFFHGTTFGKVFTSVIVNSVVRTEYHRFGLSWWLRG